jgi:hypothetical protein
MMHNDLIARIPGGDRMAGGAVLFAIGLVLFNYFEFQSLAFVRLPLAAVSAYGFFKFSQGLVEWKYSNSSLHTLLNQPEHLLIDIPLHGGDLTTLHAVEDVLIEFCRERKTVCVEGHTVDRPNDIGTIRLKGRQADAMFASVYRVLARFSLGGTVSVFPPAGEQPDPEIRGKRVLMNVTARG